MTIKVQSGLFIKLSVLYRKKNTQHNKKKSFKMFKIRSCLFKTVLGTVLEKGWKTSNESQLDWLAVHATTNSWHQLPTSFNLLFVI